MADRTHRPLSRVHWFQRLEDMTQACVQSVAADQEKRILEMRDLLARAPEPALLAGLVLPDAVSLKARLDAQYLRANIDPTELYVLSPPGAQQYRLAPDQSGFDNLVLAGDWTRTAINAGCVEAAVMSGMAASRALAGVPATISGEHFMQG